MMKHVLEPNKVHLGEPEYKFGDCIGSDCMWYWKCKEPEPAVILNPCCDAEKPQWWVARPCDSPMGSTATKLPEGTTVCNDGEIHVIKEASDV
jgi:hypothetical protein